ncbi:MAG: exosortase E/protease, VPEID-CTERM system [Betaproteobacteria bacterium]
MVSLQFDSKSLTGRGGIWSLVDSLGVLAPLALAMGAVSLLLFPRKIFGTPDSSSKSLAAPSFVTLPPFKIGIALHVLLLAFFLLASQKTFAPTQSGPAWPFIWILSGVAMTAALAFALIPIRQLVASIAPKSILKVVLLGIATFIAGKLATGLWNSIGDLTMLAIVGLMKPFFQDFVFNLSERVLSLGDFAVEIAPECSGYEGIGLSAILMSGYLVVFRERLRFPNALTLVLLGVLLAWLGNVLRIIVLMLIGAYVSEDIALGAFHSKAGWILFSATTLGLAWWARQSPFFNRDTAPRQAWVNPTAPYLMPLVATLAVAMISTAFSKNFDAYYGLRVAAGILILYHYRATWRKFEFLVTSPPVLLGVGVAILWLLTAGEPKPLPADLQSPTLSSICWWTTRAIGSAVIVPICEELAFRGFLLRRLQAKAFEAVDYTRVSFVPIIVSSVAFGMLHGDRWVAATLAGVAYALLVRRSGRLFDSMIAHGVTNGMIVAYSLYFQDWQHLGA